MILNRGGYEIVPIVERDIKDDLSGESVIERFMHLPFGFIHLVDDFRKRRSTPSLSRYLPPCGRHRRRRVVHDEDLQAGAVGKVHKVLLEDAVAAGVGAAAVAEDDEHFRLRVEPFHVAVPYTPYVLAHELGSVVAGAYREIARVVGHVVDAVRHDRAFGESLEVVVEGLWRGRAVHLPVPLEVADHLLFLGVHADDGDSRLDAGGLCLVNLQELGVPVLNLAQRKAFAERPPLEPGTLHHLSHDIFGHVVSRFKKFTADLRNADVYPDDALVLRKSRHVPGNDAAERRHPFGMSLGLPFRSAAGHALPAVGRDDMVEKFTDSFGNGVWRASESLAYGPYRAAFGPRRLACNKMPSVAFFPDFDSPKLLII